MNRKNSLFFKIIAVVIVLSITIVFCVPFIKFINNPDKLRVFIESYGIMAPLAYILLTFIQILVPIIPGEPFELLAGYVFGLVKGTLLCLFAESISSIIIILMVRRYGDKIVKLFFSEDTLKKLEKYKNEKNFYIFILLFVLPGTPKDLICYFAGLTKFKLFPLLLASTLGRFPSIITSTLPGSLSGEKNYILALGIYLVVGIISFVVARIFNKKHGIWVNVSYFLTID